MRKIDILTEIISIVEFGNEVSLTVFELALEPKVVAVQEIE